MGSGVEVRLHHSKTVVRKTVALRDPSMLQGKRKESLLHVPEMFLSTHVFFILNMLSM